MNKILLFATIILAGCSGSNQYGKCIGIVEDGDPKLNYNLSVRNTVASFLGFEMLVPPVLWATTYAKCPVGYKDKK